MVEGRRKHVFRFVVWTCLQTSLWDAFEECKWLGPKPKMHRFCRLSGCQSSEKKIIWDLLCFFIVHVLCSIIQTSWPGRHWKMALLFMVFGCGAMCPKKPEAQPLLRARHSGNGLRPCKQTRHRMCRGRQCGVAHRCWSCTRWIVVSSAFARELCLNYTFLLQHVFFFPV